MSPKDQLLLEIEHTVDPILEEVLDFLQFLKAKQTQQEAEDQEDLADARLALQ
ncbi:MAG: DUF2281 domain-containing protein [Cyanobacteria bacterium P01_F01_bin.150]